MSYEDLMVRRVTWHEGNGFAPVVDHAWLFPFQSALVSWSILKGRSAIFADCGLGKTAMELAWADNVLRKTGKRVLLVTPLAVSHQTAREAEKFGIDAAVSRDGSLPSGVVITNYERLHYFNRNDFAGVVCDESSAIKNFDGKRREEVTEFMKGIDYRLLATATAAPNDYDELGTSSEALGYLGARDMRTTFFVLQQAESHGLAWGRTKFRLRGHAERPFWQWVVSWARAMRTPSDLGFSDDGYVLPPLVENEFVTEVKKRKGLLFPLPARGRTQELQERRETINERCEKVAELSGGTTPVVCWCHLNPEGDLLAKLIPDAVQVKGSMSDDEKEEKLAAFSRGEVRVLVTKPKIGCWGLNWQHCNRINTFPSHSFEQYYQSVRRCYRFGQANPVEVNVVASPGESGVVANLKHKQEKAELMFRRLVECMNNELALMAKHDFHQKEALPSWL